MKLHIVRTANRRISNIEPQDHEGWNRCALSFELIKIDRIPSFDIRYSIFDIHYSIFDIRFFRVFFSIKLAASMAGHGLNSNRLNVEHQFLFRFDRPFFWPAAGPNPEH
jgi:hypothetical protein